MSYKVFQAANERIVRKRFMEDCEPVPEGWHRKQEDALAAYGGRRAEIVPHTVEGPSALDGELEMTDGRLADAILGLDPEDDSAWTVEEGLPNLDAVKKAYGKRVSRAAIEEALPEFNRSVAYTRAEVAKFNEQFDA